MSDKFLRGSALRQYTSVTLIYSAGSYYKTVKTINENDRYCSRQLKQARLALMSSDYCTSTRDFAFMRSAYQ